MLVTIGMFSVIEQEYIICLTFTHNNWKYVNYLCKYMTNFPFTWNISNSRWNNSIFEGTETLRGEAYGVINLVLISPEMDARIVAMAYKEAVILIIMGVLVNWRTASIL